MEVITPIGRMIGGDLYKMFPRMDNYGKPKMNADGTPAQQCNFGVAIPKGGETHWSQTEWGAKIFQVGAAAWPKEHVVPSFAWKIIDGDSTVPNKKGNVPANNEHYRGHWVLWFSQGWLPKLCNADGSVELSAPGAIKPGYYVRVMADVAGNNPSPSPGVYLNPKAVALMYEGDEIVTAEGVNTAGFASAPATAAPPGARPVQAAVPGFTAPPPAPPAPAFLAVPPPAAHTMTAKAAGATYEQMIAAGWTDDLLRQHGYMV